MLFLLVLTISGLTAAAIASWVLLVSVVIGWVRGSLYIEDLRIGYGAFIAALCSTAGAITLGTLL